MKKQPTRVYLVRHGETGWNSGGRFQGLTDVGLSDRGLQQAACLRDRFANEEIDAVYSSDLSRAVQTGSAIAEAHNLKVKVLPELREINFGCWEGLTHHEISIRYPEQLKNWLPPGPGDMVIPGGESFVQVMDRAWKGVKQIVADHLGKTVVVVSHGGVIRAIICAAIQVGTSAVWHIAQDNAGVSLINFYDKRPILALFNDTHHLNGLRKTSD